MKIAMIGQKGIPCTIGGVERHVELLSVRLAREGYEVIAYARSHYTPKDLKNYKGVRLVFKPSLYTKNLDAISHTFLSILDAVFKEKVDLIHFHGIGPALLSWLPRILSPRVKVVGTFHSPDWEHKKWGLVARTMLKLGAWSICRFPHETIVVSQKLKNWCWQKFKRETHYISYGLDFENNSPKSEDLIKKFGLQTGKYFLTVSRLVRHKNIHLLIEAFKEAQLPDYKLVIVGSAYFTDDYAKYLQDLKNGNENIIFTGEQYGDNLAALYAHAYLYVHPSSSEGLCNTILEAMSFKKAPLVSDIPQNKEAIDYDAPDEAKGFVFKIEDKKDFTNQLVQLAKEPEVVIERGEAAYQHVYHNYNIDAVARKIQEIYRSLVLVSDQLAKEQDLQTLDAE